MLCILATSLAFAQSSFAGIDYSYPWYQQVSTGAITNYEIWTGMWVACPKSSSKDCTAKAGFSESVRYTFGVEVEGPVNGFLKVKAKLEASSDSGKQQFLGVTVKKGKKAQPYMYIQRIASCGYIKGKRWSTWNPMTHIETWHEDPNFDNGYICSKNILDHARPTVTYRIKNI